MTTSVVAYAEARAALARRRREGGLTAGTFATAKREFEGWWSAVLAITVSADIARTARSLAERFRLRGFDGIHLATFAKVATDRGVEAVAFSSFDQALNKAADSWLRGARRRNVSRRQARS